LSGESKRTICALRSGARVILACRRESTGQQACDEIIAETANRQAIFMQVDLASLASVRRFADQFLRRKLLLSFACTSAPFRPVFNRSSILYVL